MEDNTNIDDCCKGGKSNKLRPGDFLIKLNWKIEAEEKQQKYLRNKEIISINKYRLKLAYI